jgi:hypothetical protein
MEQSFPENNPEKRESPYNERFVIRKMPHPQHISASVKRPTFQWNAHACFLFYLSETGADIAS